MEISKPTFKKYVFVCENERPDAACCGKLGAAIRETLKQKIKALGLSSKIRVSRSGCVDVCSEGPNVLLMPDEVWFRRVSENDLGRILDEILKGI